MRFEKNGPDLELMFTVAPFCTGTTKIEAHEKREREL